MIFPNNYILYDGERRRGKGRGSSGGEGRKKGRGRTGLDIIASVLRLVYRSSPGERKKEGQPE